MTHAMNIGAFYGYVMFFECLTIANVYPLITGNITFETSPSQLHLPRGLYGHLSTVYNHSELHVFGGYMNDNLRTPSYSIYTIRSDNTGILNGTIRNESFTSLPIWDWDYVPPTILHYATNPFVSPSSISCTVSNQCYDTINDWLYAFIPSDAQDNIFVYKYNMITKTLFTGTSSSNTNYVGHIAQPYPIDPALYFYNHEYENVTYYLNGCIVSDGIRYIYSFGTTASSGVKYHGFRYDAWADEFMLRDFDLFNTGYDVGCAIDVSKQNIYIFGGRYYTDFELDIIEKWNLKNESSIVMAETLQYARSKCTVTRTKNNHFIIIGGTTYESKRHMEVFNAHTDEMVLLLAMDIDLANMEQFTAFLFRDMLYINGGMNNVSDSETNRAFLYTNVTEHVQRYFASNHTEIAENITTSEDDVDTTFRWETLPIHLPHPLTGHISSVYDDTLYIIGGYVDGDHESPSQFTYTSLESLSHLLGDKSQIITTGGLNFEITSQIMPRWDKGIDPVIIAFGYTAPSFTVAPSAISCPHSWYT
eukprot:622046_1